MTKKTRFSLALASLFPVLTIPTEAVETSELWLKHCKRCHAEDGSGNTKMGKKLKVQDYTDPAVQAKMTDEEMTQMILEGKKSESGKTLMAAYAEKLTAEEISAMVAYIRTMKKE